MRGIYVDESAQGKRYYALGALVADQQAIQHIEAGLHHVGDLLASEGAIPSSAMEFHAYEMFQGKQEWSGVPVWARIKAFKLVLKVILSSGAQFVWRAIDVEAHERMYSNPFPQHQLVFAQVLEAVNNLLPAQEAGIVLADEHHTAEDSRRKLTAFKRQVVPGYTQVRLDRILDTVYFGPSGTSRPLQAADVATYVWTRHRVGPASSAQAQRDFDECVELVRKFTVHQYLWVPR